MRLLVADVSALFHAAWHASSGQSVNGARDYVLSVIRGHLQGNAYDRVAVAVDSPRSLRKEEWGEYKANREPADRMMISQLRDTIEQLARDGAHVFESPGYEADDIAASLVAWARDTGAFAEVVLLSDDKDWAQLVYDPTGDSETAVSLYRPRARQHMRTADVIERWGVRPGQLGDWLALVGDSSDNVPGVTGVGPKKATQLLAAFGNLRALTDAVVEESEAIAFDGGPKKPRFTPKLAESLLASRDEYDLVAGESRRMVELRHEALTYDQCAHVLTEPQSAPPAEPIDFSIEDDDMTPSIPPPEDTNPSPAPESIEGEPVSAPAPEPAPRAAPAPAAERPVRATGPSELVVRREMPFKLSLEPMTPTQAYNLAKSVCESRLFTAYGNPDAVMAIILRGRALGLDAMTAVTSMHIIKGKPVMSAQLMQSLVLQSGLCESFDLVETTSERAVYVTRRKGSKRDVTMEFTIQDAHEAGLVGKPDSNWARMPRTMLRWRCVSELCRAVYPDVITGVYTPEELDDGPEYVQEAAQ